MSNLLEFTFTPEYAAALASLEGVLSLPPDPSHLPLTEAVIRLNPSNYVAWAHRRACLPLSGASWRGLERGLTAELLRAHPKNYQLWQQRLWTAEGATDGHDEELALVDELLAVDAKNYHAWMHRSAMAEAQKWEIEKEIEYASNITNMDVRNNSAWSYLVTLLLRRTFDPQRLLALAAAGAARAPRAEPPFSAAKAAVKAGAMLAGSPICTVLGRYGAADACPLSPACADFVLWMDCQEIEHPFVAATPAELAKECAKLEPTRERFWKWQAERAAAKLAKSN